MYSLAGIKRAIRDPARAIREANKFFHTRGFRRDFNPDGVNVLDRDWDNLIILDACRYDYFKEVADLQGTTGYVESIGSATYRFIRGTFTNRTLYDTVYVMDNGWYLQLKDEINSDIFDHYNLHSGNYDVTWADEELGVVAPESVTEYAKRAVNQYEDKRLIVHYLQPHHPFLGETGETFTQHSSSLLEVIDENENATREQLRRSYRENLELVLEEVTELLPELTGRTVITADHGEMLGDRHDFFPMRDYGHHPGIYNDATVKVPWHVVENGERRDIRAQEPKEQEEIDAAKLKEQLQQLGYKM